MHEMTSNGSVQMHLKVLFSNKTCNANIRFTHQIQNKLCHLDINSSIPPSMGAELHTLHIYEHWKLVDFRYEIQYTYKFFVSLISNAWTSFGIDISVNKMPKWNCVSSGFGKKRDAKFAVLTIVLVFVLKSFCQNSVWQTISN